MNSLLKLAFLGLAAVLSGCATVPLTSIVALSAIQLETTDLAVLRVAARLPEALRPASDGVSLRTAIGVEGLGETTKDYALVAVAEPGGPDDGQRIDPGYAVHVFALSPEARQGFDAVRRTIAEARAAGRHGSLQLSVSLGQFCSAGPLPEGPLFLTTLIRTSETGRFVVLSDRVDIRQAPEFADALKQMQPCPAQ